MADIYETKVCPLAKVMRRELIFTKRNFSGVFRQEKQRIHPRHSFRIDFQNALSHHLRLIPPQSTSQSNNLTVLMRRELKKRGIERLKVVYSEEMPLTPYSPEKEPSLIPYSFALTASSSLAVTVSMASTI